MENYNLIGPWIAVTFIILCVFLFNRGEERVKYKMVSDSYQNCVEVETGKSVFAYYQKYGIYPVCHNISRY